MLFLVLISTTKTVYFAFDAIRKTVVPDYNDIKQLNVLK